MSESEEDLFLFGFSILIWIKDKLSVEDFILFKFWVSAISFFSILFVLSFNAFSFFKESNFLIWAWLTSYDSFIAFFIVSEFPFFGFSVIFMFSKL